MKVRASLKKRTPDCKIVRRNGRLYVINKKNPIVRRNGRLYVINKKNPKYKQRQG